MTGRGEWGKRKSKGGHTSLCQHGFENQSFLQLSQPLGSILLGRGFGADL